MPRASVRSTVLAAVMAFGCSQGMPEAPPGGPTLVDTACPARNEAPAVDCAGGPRSSPFTCVRFDPDCAVDVQLEPDGDWYRLEGVNGVRIGALRALADTACGPVGPLSGIGSGGWKKRLAEDLPALLAAVCAPLGERAGLALRRFGDGSWIVREAVDTADNRERVRTCWPSHDACNG
jgi:hypothetical protein